MIARRSKRRLVEQTTHIAVADLRYDLHHEEGRDRQRVCIVGGPAAGLTVQITWSRLKFGWRPWFLCPECSRRAGRLYTDGHRWLCRTCQCLDYRSQRNQPYQRSVARALRIRRRLGQIYGWAGAPLPPPPRGMHTSTYVRLIHDLIEHERRAGSVIGPRAAKSIARLKTKLR